MKNILVTGGTSGIGKSISILLISLGYRVIVMGRNFENFGEIQGAIGSAEFLDFDLNHFDKYRGMVERLPALDGVVFSAGIVGNNPLKFFSLDKHLAQININQNSPIFLTSELVARNKLNRNASLVYMSSITGSKIGMKGIVSYAASKAALVGAVRVIALELAAKFIRANCVSPGMVNTELVSNASYLSDDAKTQDMKRYPLGARYADPSEIAKAVVFLLSSDSSFITGQDMVIDGGFVLN